MNFAYNIISKKIPSLCFSFLFCGKKYWSFPKGKLYGECCSSGLSILLGRWDLFSMTLIGTFNFFFFREVLPKDHYQVFWEDSFSSSQYLLFKVLETLGFPQLMVECITFASCLDCGVYLKRHTGLGISGQWCSHIPRILELTNSASVWSWFELLIYRKFSSQLGKDFDPPRKVKIWLMGLILVTFFLKKYF